MQKQTKTLKTKIFSKTAVIAMVAMLVIGLPAMAALLTYYGKVTATVNVEQSILVDNQDYTAVDIIDVISEPAPGGEKFCFKHWLKNQMSVEGEVGLEAYCYDGEGITTTYYTMPSTTTLILENKDSSWNVIVDNRQANLTFDVVNTAFNYGLTATGLSGNTEYAIIYYADKPNRYVNWGGDNPGKLIDTFTTNASGDYIGSNSVELNMNLPTEPDKNINEYDYCVLDGYIHCYGAKIWIVPLSDYNEPVLATWNPTTYLFETDMITYFDCNITELTSNYPIDEYGMNVSEITLESGENKPFFICYDFATNIVPKTYTITTTVVPK